MAGLPVGYQFKNITDADVNNLLLEDLIIWTNYEIEVAAYNSAGLGVYSSKVTEWTLQGGGWGRGPCKSRCVPFSRSPSLSACMPAGPSTCPLMNTPVHVVDFAWALIMVLGVIPPTHTLPGSHGADGREEESG